MNIEDIIKNAPSGATKYSVLGGGFVEYFKEVDSVPYFYSYFSNTWVVSSYGFLGYLNVHLLPIYVKADVDTNALDKSVGIQEVTLKLDETLVKDIKALAQLKKVRYKVLMKQVLQNFVDEEQKKLHCF